MRLAIVVLWLSVALQAQAQRVELHAGETCLRREQLRLDEWITPEEIPTGVWLEVRGSAIDPRSVEVLVHGARGVIGQRSFAPGPERCADLHHAVALAGAMLMRTSARPAQRPWELGARALLSVSAQVAAGARVHGGIRWGRVDGALAALALQGRTEIAIGSYQTRVLAGGASACLRALERRSVDLRWCLDVWVGQLRASGRGFAPSVTSKLRWAALTTGPTFSLRMRARWWLSAQADFALPLLDSQVEVGATRERVSRPALLAGLGFAYRAAP